MLKIIKVYDSEEVQVRGLLARFKRWYFVKRVRRYETPDWPGEGSQAIEVHRGSRFALYKYQIRRLLLRVRDWFARIG